MIIRGSIIRICSTWFLDIIISTCFTWFLRIDSLWIVSMRVYVCVHVCVCVCVCLHVCVHAKYAFLNRFLIFHCLTRILCYCIQCVL